MEYLKVVFKYYRKFSFLKIDLTLICLYFFSNPFKISKRFLMKIGEKEIYAYGETPLTTMDKIAQECQIKSSDKLFELGMGRGRCCFWLQSFVGCDVVGIEFVAQFVQRATQVKKMFGLNSLEFREEDMLKSEFKGATCLYLYGTCYDTEFIKELIGKIKRLPKGTKIITVSYPLSHYSDKDLFELVKIFPAQFTWGTADVYFQKLI